MTSGVLGYGLPAAVGIALAQRDQRSNRKVICIVGDGAAQYVIQGLWTAAQLKLPILFVLMRNVEYAILKSFANEQKTPGVPGLDLPGIDSVKLAEGYGCSGDRVADPAALTSALEKGLSMDSPYLLEIGIDPNVPPLI
jgi:benzoylformate decarboxylase